MKTDRRTPYYVTIGTLTLCYRLTGKTKQGAKSIIVIIIIVGILGQVIIRFRVQFGINLHECVFQRVQIARDRRSTS
jgi:hypothetical protein